MEASLNQNSNSTFASQDVSDENESSSDEHSSPSYFLTSMDSKSHRNCMIVGIRYYNGVAHPGEFVSLVREPFNAYDRNAIRIDNVHGEKVGHIKREMAAVLAPIMDQPNVYGNIQIDGTIPEPGNQWQLPICLTFYGTDMSIEEARERTNNLEHKVFKRFAFNKRQLRASAVTTNMATTMDVNIQSRKVVDWKEQQKHLEDVFTKQSNEQLKDLPDVKLPSTLVTRLLDHQLQGLKWLVKQETETEEVPFYSQIKEHGNSVWFCEITKASQKNRPELVRGGILSDDMGLGKTLQAIALVLVNAPAGRDYTTVKNPLVSPATKSNAEIISPTGVTDFDSAVAKVPVVQKPPTKSALNKLKIDVLKNILTQSHLPVPCKKPDIVKAIVDAFDSKMISMETYEYALTHQPPSINGASTKTSDQPSFGNKTTLVVCPVSVIGNWEAQIEQHDAPGTLRIAIYHGADRKQQLENLDDIDVLVVSYNTLQYDFTCSTKDETEEPAAKRRKNNREKSIFDAHFHRVILDEAHIVRNAKSKTFQACSSLKTDRRWCLTGTPLQNKPDDIQSLFRFLRLSPVSDQYIFRRAISQPIQDGMDEGLTLLRVIMAHAALRRTKCMANFELPEKIVEIRTVEFPKDCKHGKIHEAIFDSAKFAFRATIEHGQDRKEGNNTASIFEILTRLRQACCSGSLVPAERIQRAEEVLEAIRKKGTDNLSAEEGKELLEKLKGALQMQGDNRSEEEAPPECAICFEQMQENGAVILRTCSHVFCKDCIAKLACKFKSNCPFCRQSFQEKDMIAWNAALAASTQDASEEKLSLSLQIGDLGPSPKVKALMQAINEIKPGEKVVIFSQFTTFLDEIEKTLMSYGHITARIDGKKSSAQRIQSMRIFSQEVGGPKFMLCSLHAAGTGINLTRANHIFMMDTWWNKAVELQAQDRVHRIGQNRQVHVVRFVAADTVESRMIDLQEAKAAMGKGAFESLTPEEKKKARFDDVKKLLDLD